MEGRVTANVGLAPVVAVLLVASAGVSLNPADARAEANCLAAPGAQAQPGRHWFYRIDRPQQRKCWYLRAQGAAEATAKVPPKPHVHIASAAPEVKSSAGSDQLVPAIRLEPFADQPASAGADNGTAPPSIQDGALMARRADADSDAGPAAPAPIVSDAAAAPSLPPSDGRTSRSAPRIDGESIRQAHGVAAAAAKADADAYDAAEADKPAGDPVPMEASGRVSPLAFLFAGAILVIAGIFLHPIVQIFARRPVVHAGRAAPAWMTSFGGEWKMPGFLARWRGARVDRGEYHLDEI
jgi:hypothetical protein